MSLIPLFLKSKILRTVASIPTDQALTDASFLRDGLLLQNAVSVWNSTWAVRRIWDSRPAKERHKFKLLGGCDFVARPWGLCSMLSDRDISTLLADSAQKVGALEIVKSGKPVIGFALDITDIDERIEEAATVIKQLSTCVWYDLVSAERSGNPSINFEDDVMRTMYAVKSGIEYVDCACTWFLCNRVVDNFITEGFMTKIVRWLDWEEAYYCDQVVTAHARDGKVSNSLQQGDTLYRYGFKYMTEDLSQAQTVIETSAGLQVIISNASSLDASFTSAWQRLKILAYEDNGTCWIREKKFEDTKDLREYLRQKLELSNLRFHALYFPRHARMGRAMKRRFLHATSARLSILMNIKPGVPVSHKHGL